MTVGIDSNSFHRYFGEPGDDGQPDPGTRWSIAAFLQFASDLKVSSVLLEMRFLPRLDRSYLCDLRGTLHDRRLEPVLSWKPRGGLPEGSADLRSAALQSRDLLESLEAAVLVGASVLRVLVPDGGVNELARALASAAPVAERQRVAIAVELPGAATSGELTALLTRCGSAAVGASFDTGAAMIAGEDPVAAAARLGGWVRTVQVQDLAMTQSPDVSLDGASGGGLTRRIAAGRGVPAGRGVIDLPGVIRQLRACGYAGSLHAKIEATSPLWRGQRDEDIIRESVGYLRKVSGS